MNQQGQSFADPVEHLTHQFYSWETRGRGWGVWPEPVSLEPPFKPFFHLPCQTTVTQNKYDDTRKPGIFEIVKNLFRLPPPPPVPSFPEFEEIQPCFSEDESLTTIQIGLPPDLEIGKAISEQFLLNLSYCSYPVSFEIIGTSTVIVPQITCRESDKHNIRQQLQSYFPQLILREEKDYLQEQWALPESDEEHPPVIVEFGLSKEFMLPLKRLRDFDVDPWIGVAGTLSHLKKGEIGVFQVLFQKTAYPWMENIVRSVTDWEGEPFFVDAPEMVPLAKEKIRRPLFAAVVRIAGRGETEQQGWRITKGIGSVLTQFSDPSSNELIPLSNDDHPCEVRENDLLFRQTHRSGMILNSEELVSLVHLPSQSVFSLKLRLPENKPEITKKAPSLAVGHDLILGENVCEGKTTLVSLSPSQRTRHVYLIGASGTGKSTLLLNMIAQDIEKGRGVAVLDPHGDLIDQIIARIPEERHEDVVLFDPSDEEYPVGFNILSSHSEVEKNLLASDLVAVFRRLSSRWGDQMNSVLANAIMAFLESEQGGTLADLRRFLIEEEFRLSFLETVKDHEIVYYWQKEFPLLPGNPQAPLLTRLDVFLRPKLIRRMVSQRDSRLDFGKIMNTGKIFLGKLSQGAIGEENAYLLGTLLVSKFHQTAISRQEMKEEERRDFFLYIDEFHNFVTPSMASILSGARKYRLGLCLAHQEFRQLWEKDKEVSAAVIANPYTRICFRLGEFDAKKLQEGFSFFKAEDLQNLGTGEAICRMERAEYDFNLKTFPLPKVDAETEKQRSEKIISLSREKYGTKRSEVEESLRASVEISSSVPREYRRPPERKAEEKPVYVAREPVPKKELLEIKEISRDSVKDPLLLGRGGHQHKELQNLIKRYAEEKGFRATIEKEVVGQGGRIDVVLEKSGRESVACEVSVTTSPDQEMGNIRKCLSGGYKRILLVSAERKTLNKVRESATEQLSPEELACVQFVTPDEFISFLEEVDARGAGGGEETRKGYKTKAVFNPVEHEEKEMGKQSLFKTMLDSLKRKKKE